MKKISVSVKKITKNYGEVKAVRDVSFNVMRGEVFGFLGPNGAGKTTTIRMITTATKPTSGTALINDFDVEKDPVNAKRTICVVSQYINIDMELTSAENLIVHGMLYHMRKKAINSKVDELLDFIEMSDKKNIAAGKISGGMQRKLMIARALLHEPEILFLDEPTVGLDARSKRKIWDLLMKINSEGRTIFLTTHYIEEAEELCDRVGIIDEGKLIALDTPKKLIKEVGETAVDIFTDDIFSTEFFADREGALETVKGIKDKVIIRKTNLEDVFLKKTGKRVES
ncbi:MAG: ATP-binding cassette domain-containing protein [Actinomycetia bacterium]|nr:ATP-binding cassette domain-containing protein [Actinomycetes bacterium]